MRKDQVLICSLLVAIVLIVVPAYAQKLPQRDVPSAVISAFEKAYPKATIKTYSKEERDGKTVYEIESMDGKIRRDIIYSANGTALEVEERISPTDLPDAVKQAIGKGYPKSTVRSAEKLTKGRVTEYEVAIEKRKKNLEVVFDENGKVVKAPKP